MMSKLAITLTAAFLTVFIQVNGQQNINLPQAIDLVEQKQKVKFFYRHEWIQHITVDRTLTDRPLVDFLKESLQGTGLHYILHQKQYVILLKDFKDTVDIKTALALDEKNFIPDGRLYTIRGNIKDANTGESITGASVFIEEKKIGTSTNTSGFYSITLPSGVYTLKASAIGRVADQQKIILRSDMQLHFNLFDQVTQLRDVEITAEAADENISSIEMSLVKLDAKNIKSMPSFLGEPDIVKSVTLLPGVKTVGEGAGGFNVRGGNVDQNLVLLDDVPIFNTSHLFGFFSAFNTEAVKDISLFKGGIPAQYGGRISSVLDVRLKDGNAKNFEVRGSA
ncbi:MAG: carboxypeptidase-like regulatory domain-containing protein, partial [Bacteroidota bacterium]